MLNEPHWTNRTPAEIAAADTDRAAQEARDDYEASRTYALGNIGQKVVATIQLSTFDINEYVEERDAAGLTDRDVAQDIANSILCRLGQLQCAPGEGIPF